jgi:hypothetical protein
MSLKTGTRVRTFKPVVYKPSEQSIVISDKNNDRVSHFYSIFPFQLGTDGEVPTMWPNISNDCESCPGQSKEEEED